jgi:hypothetical protein
MGVFQPWGDPPQNQIQPKPTQNYYIIKFIIICLLMIVVYYVCIPSEYYYFGKQFKAYIKNEYLVKEVFDYLVKRVYDKLEVDDYDKLEVEISTHFVKEQWSLFDFWMLSILETQSMALPPVTLDPFSIKIDNDKFYSNKKDSLQSIDVVKNHLLYSIDFSDFIKKNKLENIDNAKDLFDNR